MREIWAASEWHHVRPLEFGKDGALFEAGAVWPICGQLQMQCHLPRAGEYLTRDEEGKHAGDQSFPRHVAPHQIIAVAAVAVSGEIGVVLV